MSMFVGLPILAAVSFRTMRSSWWESLGHVIGGLFLIADLVLELRNKRRITVAAASKILANLTFAYKNMGLGMGTMLAGVCISSLPEKVHELTE